MRVLIFGRGYIAGKFHAAFEGSLLSPADITDPAAVREELRRHKPEFAVNTAGKTGRPNVDWCEDHPFETWTSNTLGPLSLARACIEEGVHLTHMGSGCVYEGDNGGKGYREEDPPNFFGSFYSRSKIWSEQALRELPVLQLRMRMPLDGEPNPRNLITKITAYPKVISVPNSLSVVDDFLRAAKELMKKRRTGVYNVTNPGAIEHRRILELYREIVDPEHTWEVISTKQLDRLTKARRSNCVLNTDKLAKEGVRLRPIEEAVRASLEEYKQRLEDGAAA
jgi:dTDP-4-dehydrorhamnose reductase